MIPTLVLVGRPNVGKSTLFNRLTKTRDAIVADMPGLTRDRHYGHGRVGIKPYLVVDTGGFEPLVTEGIMHEMARQTEQAMLEADAVVFVVDGRQGLTAHDKEIGIKLRKLSCPVFIAVNKTEGMNRPIVEAEFHELGLGEPYAISSAHGDGVMSLFELVLEGFPDPVEKSEEEETDDSQPARPPKVAIIGRPNVGKSTLTNTLVGEQRVIAFDQPGTTRDSIYIDFKRNGRDYTLIDTAGVRRKGRVFEAVEKFSVIKTLQAIEDANVVVLVLDAQQDISDQDAHLGGFVAECGRALVVAVNKWDNLDSYLRERVKVEIGQRFHFLDFARFHYISALEGDGIGNLVKSVDAAHAAAMAKMPTPKLTRAMIAAVAKQAPPRHGVSRPKLRYAHQGGQNPPIVIIHGQALDHVPDSYRRYLEGVFRKTFELEGTPLRVEFRTAHNPYVNKDAPPPRSQRSGRGQVRDQKKSAGPIAAKGSKSGKGGSRPGKSTGRGR